MEEWTKLIGSFGKIRHSEKIIAELTSTVFNSERDSISISFVSSSREAAGLFRFNVFQWIYEILEDSRAPATCRRWCIIKTDSPLCKKLVTPVVLWKLITVLKLLRRLPGNLHNRLHRSRIVASSFLLSRISRDMIEVASKSLHRATCCSVTYESRK